MKFVMNKLMKNLLLAFCIFTLGLSLHGQTGTKFNKLIHDFGNVKEEEDSVTTIFSFKNTSSKPIIIVKVETSCGCTKPRYSNDSIMPGDTGFVKAIYETRGRSGSFYKNLFVHFNNDAYYQSLAIKGNVIPEANLANKPAEFTTTYSNLAFTNTIASFPNLLNTQKQEYKIKVYNYMGYPIRIHEVKSMPDYVTLDLGDSLIDVEDTLTITVKVDGSKMHEFGDQTRPISLQTDDPGSQLKFLYVRTNLKEDFSKFSNKDLKNAPKIHMDTMGPINFGKHSAGEKVSYTIKVTNNGKKDLNIRKIVPSCSCVTFSIGKQVLKAGESVNLVFTLDTVNQMKAELIKYVTMVTNDPSRPEIKIKLTITVTN
jgi:hypothetical protein